MDAILNVLSSIGFDWRVALANFINFLIVLYLLNRFVFKGIKGALKERQKKIDQGLADAHKAETSLQLAREQEASLIRAASVKANDLVAKASERGNQLIKQAEARGAKQVADQLEQAAAEVQQIKVKVAQEARQAAVKLVVTGAEKLLLAEVAGEKNEAFINRLLAQDN